MSRAMVIMPTVDWKELIDRMALGGTDVRLIIKNNYFKVISKARKKIYHFVDFCKRAIWFELSVSLTTTYIRPHQR